MSSQIMQIFPIRFANGVLRPKRPIEFVVNYDEKSEMYSVVNTKFDLSVFSTSFLELLDHVNREITYCWNYLTNSDPHSYPGLEQIYREHFEFSEE